MEFVFLPWGTFGWVVCGGRIDTTDDGSAVCGDAGGPGAVWIGVDVKVRARRVILCELVGVLDCFWRSHGRVLH